MRLELSLSSPLHERHVVAYSSGAFTAESADRFHPSLSSEPASKKRRCRMSRDAGQRLGGERYGARYEVPDLGNSKSGGLETRGRIKQCGANFANK
jgi:hypothetical protein